MIYATRIETESRLDIEYKRDELKELRNRAEDDDEMKHED